MRHAHARRLKLAVDPRDGTVRLTLPPRAALGPALAWVETRRD
ncbi:MAG: metal-dependent hydrolase, partial [Sphingomonadales bacterium]